MEDDSKFTLKSRLASFRYAFNGLRALLKFEHNSRIHLVLTIAVIIAGIVFKPGLTDWMLLILVIGLVFMAELFNSSVEELADLIDPEQNETIRRVKDYAAAGVLIAALIAVAVGCLIFIPKIWNG